MTSSSHLYNNYAPIDLAFESGSGPYLQGDDGKTYLDFAAGLAVNSWGHGHPRLVEALQTQAAKLWHCSNMYRIPQQERLGRRLAQETFASKVFFANSGAEVVECAIKTARRYFEGHTPARYEIITFEGAFHGRTLAALAAGGKPEHLQGFDPVMPGFVKVPFANIEVLREALSNKTAAVLLEPIQGEGGVRVVEPSFIQKVRKLCDDVGALLIFDEVQCGMGRTGTLFAYEWLGVTPDILTAAKALGGGLPLGACLAREGVADAMVPGSHGSTFGGNPLSMAVGNAVLDIVLEDGFLETVRTRALRLKQNLAELVDEYPSIFKDMRGQGMLIGMPCHIPSKEVAQAFMRQGLLVATASNNVVRLLPPLIIEDKHIDEALSKMRAACDQLSQ